MRPNEIRFNSRQKEAVSQPFVVTLPTPKVIRKIPSSQVVVSKIEIDHFVDSPSEKVLEAYDKKIGKIVLFEGDAYDAIGNWTNEDVEKRLKEIYK